MAGDRPSDLPPGVAYAGPAPGVHANGHGLPGHHGHYAALTQVTLPRSGMVVTVRPVDGLDLYRLGLPPTFFAGAVQQLAEGVQVGAPDAEHATAHMELLVAAADRFASFAILSPRPVASPDLVTGPDTFCPAILWTTDKVWLLNRFVLNPESQAAVAALFRPDTGLADSSLAAPPDGPGVSPAPQRLARPAAGQRRRA